jgi:hypothetical protein
LLELRFRQQQVGFAHAHHRLILKDAIVSYWR